MSVKDLVFVDNSTPQCDAQFLNSVENEINNTIISTGITPNVANLNQLGQAISEYSAGSDFYTDTGSADAYVLAAVGSKETPHAYFVGMSFRCIIGNTNLTTTPTINVAGLGVKNIKSNTGGTVGIGDLTANTQVTFYYDGTNVREAYGVTASPTSPTILMVEQGSAPSTPSSGISTLYFDTNHVLNGLDSSGNVKPIPYLNTVNVFTKAQRGALYLLTYGSTITPDFSLANNYTVQLTGNATLKNPTNLGVGQSGKIDIYQDATGSRSLAYDWGFVFPGSTPTLSTVGATRDALYYDVDIYNTSTVTITIATPGIVTWANHGLVTGNKIQLTTTGALPTGLSASTTYYVIYIGSGTFSLATSLANAAAGTSIGTSGSQSGTHTAKAVTILANLVKAFA